MYTLLRYGCLFYSHNNFPYETESTVLSTLVFTRAIFASKPFTISTNTTFQQHDTCVCMLFYQTRSSRGAHWFEQENRTFCARYVTHYKRQFAGRFFFFGFSFTRSLCEKSNKFNRIGFLLKRFKTLFPTNFRN